MDFVEALAALGLDDDAELTRDRVRRTYLRKVREHPPERDPEGFRKVREAYEVLRYMPTPEERVEWARLAEADEHLADGAPSTAEPDLDGASDVEDDCVDPAELEIPPELFLVVRLEAMLEEVLALLAAGEISRAFDVHTAWRSETHDDDHRWISQFTAMRWMLTRELLAISPAMAPEVVAAIALGIAANDLESARPALATFRRAHPDKANDAAIVLSQRTLALSKQIDDALDGSVRRVLSTLERRLRPLAVLVPIIIVVVMAAQSRDRSDKSRDERTRTYSVVAPAPPPAGTAPEVLLQEIRLSTNALQGMKLAAYNVGSYAADVSSGAKRCPGLVIALEELEKSVSSKTPDVQKAAGDHLAAIRLRVDLLCGPVH